MSDIVEEKPIVAYVASVYRLAVGRRAVVTHVDHPRLGKQEVVTTSTVQSIEANGVDFTTHNTRYVKAAA